jgi:hypothetical protein
MVDQPIDVKVIKTYAASIGSGNDIIIEISLDNKNGDKYFSVHINTHNIETKVYKYPDVNDQIYMIIDMIDEKGGTIVDNLGNILGPHLLKNNNDKYYISTMNEEDDTFIMRDDIVSKYTLLDDHDFFEKLVNKY